MAPGVTLEKASAGDTARPVQSTKGSGTNGGANCGTEK